MVFCIFYNSKNFQILNSLIKFLIENHFIHMESHTLPYIYLSFLHVFPFTSKKKKRNLNHNSASSILSYSFLHLSTINKLPKKNLK